MAGWPGRSTALAMIVAAGLVAIGSAVSWIGLRETAPRRSMAPAEPMTVETRFRYNPDVKSLPAMVPAVIPLLLMMMPPPQCPPPDTLRMLWPFTCT